MFSEAAFTLEVIHNFPPSAPAVSDQTATEREAFVYTFPASTDADNHAITYTAVLANGYPLPGWLTFDAANRTFRGTPLELDSPKRHQIKVTAFDNGWPPASSQSEFQLWVPEEDSPPIAVAIAGLYPPEMKTGDSESDLLRVHSGDEVTLDGSGSSDPEGATISFEWTQIEGSKVTLDYLEKEGHKYATFIAPNWGTFVFKLVVKDEYFFSDPDFVRVTVDGSEYVEDPPDHIFPALSFGSAAIEEQVYWVGPGHRNCPVTGSYGWYWSSDL